MAIWIVLLALAAYCGGVGTGWPLLQHASYALGVVVVASCVIALVARRGLSASLVADSTHAVMGEATEETIAVKKRGIFPALWLTLVDAETGNHAYLGLWGGERREWQRTRVFLHRGQYTVGGDQLRVRDPFGLFSLSACRLDERNVTVYPSPIPVDLPQELQGMLNKRPRPWSEPADASVGDLRQYTPGDPPSRIHWRSTARTGTLIVADPEPRSRRSAWLVVDLGGGDGAADRSAGIAAYLCSVLSPAGLRVGAVVAGMETVVVTPRQGPAATAAVLDALARVPAGDTPGLENAVRVLSHAEEPDALIVVSPALTTSHAMGRLRRMSRSLALVPSTVSEPPG